MTKPISGKIVAGTQAPAIPAHGYARVDPVATVTAVSTATPNIESNMYSVSVSVAATSVGIFFDPVLTERKEQTASLNKTVEFGYTPPISSTAG